MHENVLIVVVEGVVILIKWNSAVAVLLMCGESFCIRGQEQLCGNGETLWLVIPCQGV